MNLKSDINGALALSTNRTYSKYSKIYAFTTENIAGYYDIIDFKNKSVLTVASSGDHSLNAILMGASQLTTFDINQLAYYFSNLKYTAIRVLEYEEFNGYFMLDTNDSFSYEIFTKIADYLDEDVCTFFQKLYCYYGYDGNQLRKSNLFNNSYDNISLKNRYNLYLNKKQYNKVRKNMVEIEFICSSFHTISEHVNEKYDVILLSNISDYIEPIFSSDYLNKYKNFIVNDLSKLLNHDGVIILGYIYDYRDGVEGRSDIDCSSKREEIFKDKCFEIYQFESAIDESIKDAIIIYRKDG